MKILSFILIAIFAAFTSFSQVKNCPGIMSKSEFQSDPEVGSLLDNSKYHFVAILKYYGKDSIVYENLIKRNGLIPYQNEPGDLKIVFFNDEPRNVFEYSLFSPSNYYSNIDKTVYKKLLKKGIEIEVDLPKQCEFHSFTFVDDKYPDKIYNFNVQDAYFKEYEKYFLSQY